jgi:nicotinamidase-related amidase
MNLVNVQFIREPYGSGEHLVTRLAGPILVLKSLGLDALLSRHGIKSAILCGISTSACVIRMARVAGDDGYILVVIEDACLDPVLKLHDFFVQNVLPLQAHVATAENSQEEWSNANGNVAAIA